MSAPRRSPRVVGEGYRVPEWERAAGEVGWVLRGSVCRTPLTPSLLERRTTTFAKQLVTAHYPAKQPADGDHWELDYRGVSAATTPPAAPCRSASHSASSGEHLPPLRKQCREAQERGSRV